MPAPQEMVGRFESRPAGRRLRNAQPALEVAGDPFRVADAQGDPAVLLAAPRQERAVGQAPVQAPMREPEPVAPSAAPSGQAHAGAEQEVEVERFPERRQFGMPADAQVAAGVVAGGTHGGDVLTPDPRRLPQQHAVTDDDLVAEHPQPRPQQHPADLRRQRGRQQQHDDEPQADQARLEIGGGVVQQQPDARADGDDRHQQHERIGDRPGERSQRRSHDLHRHRGRAPGAPAPAVRGEQVAGPRAHGARRITLNARRGTWITP
ncbi:hypothetical protein ABZ801_30005 [Actinomadura sp. NPDC047616]|uniref:hypothetical protein n=1 Tax=Actinomadura sp. NPDC047616 TaxID=3155914 RepID=UPI0033E45F6D